MNELDIIAQEQADKSVAAIKKLEYIDDETKHIAMNYVKTVVMMNFFQEEFANF